MDASKDAEPRKVSNRTRKKRLLWLIALVGIVSMLGFGYWLLVLRYRVATDNAYVMADSARISSRVPGTVLRLLVENDQPVECGETLLELDRRDYQAAVEEVQGVLARVEADIKATEVSIAVTDTQTATSVKTAKAALQEVREREREKLHKLEELQKKRIAVRADLGKARRDFKRFNSLYRSGAISEHQRDGAHTTLIKAKAELESIDAELAGVRAFLQAVGQEVEQAQAQLQKASSDRRRVEMEREKLAALEGERRQTLARLKAAELNLSYCTIAAPIRGYIAQRNVQVGDRIQPAQPLMAVVPLQDAYVEANFKETQLEYVRVGQPASIQADIYSGHTYHGTVVGIRAGTGAAFSLLPPENATGNWIKVVQRVPVKIELNEPPPPDFPLRVGLSLEVTISTRDRSGRMLVPHSSKP